MSNAINGHLDRARALLHVDRGRGRIGGQREHVVHLADEVSQLTLSFQQAKSLQLDEIMPASAMHRQSESARSPEIVSLVLNHSDGLAPQILQVRFGYFSGLWAVRLEPREERRPVIP